MKTTKITQGAMAALMLALAQVVQAASGTYTGAADAMWMNTGNWSSGTVPGASDTATFNSAANGNTTIDLGGIASAVTAVYFDTVDVAAFTIGSGGVNGQTLTLGNAANAGTISMTSTVANNQTFDSALTLGNSGTTASYTLANAASAQILTFNGDITGGSGGTAGTKTLTLNATGTITLNGSLSKGGATALNLTKTGAGTLNLNGATTVGGLIVGQNATSGTATVGSGVTMTVGSGAGSALYVGYNTGGSNPVGIGTLDLTSAQGLIANVGTIGVGYSTAPTSQAGTSTGVLTLGGAGTITADNFYVGVGQSSGAAGNFKTNGKFSLAPGATLTLSGTSSAGAILYVGWSFGGSNASAQIGEMDLSLGSVNLTLSRLSVSRSSNSVSGTGTLTLSSSFSNHLVVSGAGSVVTIGYSTGGTGQGTVSLRNLDATSAVTSTDNSTAILLGANNANATGRLILSGGTLTITTTGSAITKGTGKGYLTLDNVTLIAGASNATSGKWITGLTTATLTGSVTLDSGTFTVSSDQVFSGSGSLTKAGDGMLTLGGASSYSGVTTISAGTLVVGSMANGGAVSPLGSFTAGAGGLVLNGGTLQYTGATATSTRGFTLAASSTIDVTPAVDSATLTLGASSLGAFTLNVTGTSGSLSLGALTLTGAATLNPTTASLTVASVGGTQDLTLGGTATGNAVSGAVGIGGSSTLAKSGGGTWTLQGACDAGTVSVAAGTLSMGASSSLSETVTIAVSAGATLDVSASASYAPVATQTYAMTVDSAGSGAAGRINAAGLDITNMKLAFNVVGAPLNDGVYILADYDSLTGSQFTQVTGLPEGYAIVYGYNGGPQIALVQAASQGTIIAVR